MSKDKIIKEMEEEKIRDYLFEKYYIRTYNEAVDIMNKKYPTFFKRWGKRGEFDELHIRILKKKINNVLK